MVNAVILNLGMYSDTDYGRMMTKGQIISKWFFGVFDFLQKTNENKST